jgi:hypothetical protein
MPELEFTSKSIITTVTSLLAVLLIVDGYVAISLAGEDIVVVELEL